MSTVAGFFTGMALVLVCISVHEFAHAWAADTLGDSTPRYKGRVTLDPLAHLDPYGTLMILFSSIAGVGIGWGKPVTVVPANFRRNPAAGLALSSAAGPLSNLAQAILAAVLLQGVQLLDPAMPATLATFFRVLVILCGLAALAAGGALIVRWYRARRPFAPNRYGDFSWKVVDPLGKTPWWESDDLLGWGVRGGILGALLFGLLAAPQGVLVAAVLVNLALMLFNLIPLGPLDGNGILRGVLLNVRATWAYDTVRFLDRIGPYSTFILLGLIVLDGMIPILSTTLFWGTRAIAGLLGV